MASKCIERPSEFAGGFPYLPTAIIAEILARLPLNSIGRCRCVCKSWAALTSSPSFINTHLDLHSSNNRRRRRQTLCTLPFWHRNYRRGMYLLRRGADADPLLLDFPSPIHFEHSPESHVRACSHRGLVCLWAHASASPVYLWNPSTRETRELPAGRRHYSHLVRFAWVGLGSLRLSDGTEDYKVVRILSLFDKGRGQEIAVEVYSLRRDSWNDVALDSKTTSLIHLCSADVAVVNRTVNWIGMRNSSGFALVSFDVAAEILRCVDFSPNGLFTPRIGAWKGSVGVWVETETGDWEVWVTGENNSWAKVFVFRPDDRVGRSATPVGLTAGGEILLSEKGNGRMRMAAMEEGNMGVKVVDEDFVLPMDADVGSMCGIYDYVESLASVNYMPIN